MSKIIIQLQGGLVQDVFIQGKGIPTKAIVVDEDTDAEQSDQTSVQIKSGKIYRAVLGTWDLSKLPKDSDVDRIVNKYLEKK
jgi:hypothetical protein